MLTLAELKELLEKKSSRYKEVIETAEKDADGQGRDLTEAEDKECGELLTDIDSLRKRVERKEKLDSLQRGAGRITAPPLIDPPDDPDDGTDVRDDKPKIEHVVPAGVRRFGRLQHFTRARFGDDAEYRAYRMGMTVFAMCGNQRAAKWCADHGYHLRADKSTDRETRVHKESVNYQGGYLVPEEIDGDLIDLREQYGVFRQFARPSPMTRDTKSRRRRAGGLTAYFVGEGAQGTESTKSWDQVTLTAKKLMVLSTVTNELNEDSVINVGDDLAGEIAYAFAEKEDDCGFNGDGTSTYGGIVGVNAALKNLSSTIANIAGLKVGTGNAYSELVLADFESVVALLPQYADTANARWFVHRSFYYEVMLKLALAAGGVDKTEIIEGQRTPLFLGYPVAISQKQPKTEGNSQVCAILGDLRLAADYGDRRQTTIAFSTDATVNSVSVFEYDELAIRGTERFDINVHDVGNATATTADKAPGPIVGLITAAS